jgi:Fic family protein
MFKNETIVITPELIELIEQIDTFNSSGQTLRTLAPEQLKALRHITTIESVGSSTRIEGSNLSDRQVEKLLSRVRIGSFKNRDEEEASGYEIVHASLPRLASDILKLVQDQEKITTANIIQATNAPRSTIKKYLNMLVDQKQLTRHGQGRSVWYTQG